MLTRGGEESPEEETVAGVHIHRVIEPKRPTDLGEFVAWVERMNPTCSPPASSSVTASSSISSTDTIGSSRWPATTWRGASAARS